MARNESSRAVLGPLMGKLRKVQAVAKESSIAWVPVLEGHLAIGHRPKIKTIKSMHSIGTTHVMTLLSESEGAETVGNHVRQAGLEWFWLPLVSGDPPPDERRAEIVQMFDEIRNALNHQARLYLHCSAGIHRTGLISYALLRHVGLTSEEAKNALSQLRQETAAGVGLERMQWGEQFGCSNR
ncbi:MAG: tyrosine-protein phosphatase [Pirellulaceae bacterium]|jgi:protein-tyrosine phosphatase|nr:tyrosine-protein phosphatase [Pirellulaceae bacterium]